MQKLQKQLTSTKPSEMTPLLTPEGNGYEFGYAVFEELPDIHTFEINEVIAGDKEIKNDPDLHDTLQCIDNPITPE